MILTKYRDFYISMTRTKLFVYDDSECLNLVGCAGVKKPEDFDFKALFYIAMAESKYIE